MPDETVSCPFGLYIHVPFCRVRCSYCDFYMVVDTKGPLRERFIKALCKEIEASPFKGQKADSLYLGGGTPSLLDTSELEAIYNSAKNTFDLNPDAEITLEANPEDVTPEAAKAWKGIGVNRVSLGVQSTDDGVLKKLMRPHDFAQARLAYDTLRSVEFKNLSLDLIAGLPGKESSTAFRKSLKELASWKPEHLSLYILELHEKAFLTRQIEQGGLALPEDEETAEDYLFACEYSEKAGLPAYEISNFARPGFESRHNSKYWSDTPYIGMGPSAHSYYHDGNRLVRAWNEPHIEHYIQSLEIGGAPSSDREIISEARRNSDRLIFGLRKTQGVDLIKIDAGFLKEKETAFQEYMALGMLEKQDSLLRLTPKGRLVSNEVFEKLL